MSSFITEINCARKIWLISKSTFLLQNHVWCLQMSSLLYKYLWRHLCSWAKSALWWEMPPAGRSLTIRPLESLSQIFFRATSLGIPSSFSMAMAIRLAIPMAACSIWSLNFPLIYFNLELNHSCPQLDDGSLCSIWSLNFPLIYFDLELNHSYP